RVRARRSATADHFGTGGSFATRNQNLRNMAGPSRRPQSRPASNQSQKTVRHHLLQTSWRQEDGSHDKQILCHNYVTDAHRLTDGSARREPVRRGSNDAGERQPAARACGAGNRPRAQCLPPIVKSKTAVYVVENAGYLKLRGSDNGSSIIVQRSLATSSPGDVEESGTTGAAGF